MRERERGPKIRAVFKHLETDEEFRARLLREHAIDFGYWVTGDELDRRAYERGEHQRRIVEGTA